MSGNLTIANDQNAVTGLSITNFGSGSATAARVTYSAAGGAPYGYVGVNPSTHTDFPDSLVLATIGNKDVSLVQNGGRRILLDTSGQIQVLARVRKSVFSGSFPTNRGDLVLEGSGGTTGSAGGLEFMGSDFGGGYGWRISAPDSGGVNLRFQRRENSASWTEVGTWTGSDFAISTSLTIGGGRKISKVTLSSSAPGALADGELYLRY
jgi:hypothetical protein